MEMIPGLPTLDPIGAPPPPPPDVMDNIWAPIEFAIRLNPVGNAVVAARDIAMERASKTDVAFAGVRLILPGIGRIGRGAEAIQLGT